MYELELLVADLCLFCKLEMCLILEITFTEL